MDPNGSKENMCNKLSKQQCLRLLNAETFQRITLSLYKYVNLENPHTLRDLLYSKWLKLGILGRVYLANEGINAQVSVPEHNWDHFIGQLNSSKHFNNIPFKIAIENNKDPFFKLIIKVRNQIVADGLSENEYDLTNVGTHLSAKEWNNAINDGATIVDMRNHYESEIGKFKGAICPDAETFEEELPIVKDLLQGREDEQILLYCTGGIRCEKTSAYLKHHCFKNVAQLHGGIIDYINQIKKDKNLENKFTGKNFVFDERLGEKITADIISKCHQCGDSCDTHVNCKNMNCNLLFLQCSKCQKKYENCCSIECIQISHLPDEQYLKLRKGVDNKKIFYSHKKVALNLNKND